jgi:Protein of unknown function (DUF1091)
LQAHYELTRKYLTSNYNYVINATLDICGFFNGTENNPVSKFFFYTIKDSLPKDIIHPCPLIGELKGYNMTLNSLPQALQLLMGSYRAVVRFYDEKDENIVTMNLFFDLKQFYFNSKDLTSAVDRNSIRIAQVEKNAT